MNEIDLIAALLANPYPHDLMAIRHEVSTSYGTDSDAEEWARCEMEAYCTEHHMLEARRKWIAAQDSARQWMQNQPVKTA